MRHLLLHDFRSGTALRRVSLPLYMQQNIFFLDYTAGVTTELREFEKKQLCFFCFWVRTLALFYSWRYVGCYEKKQIKKIRLQRRTMRLHNVFWYTEGYLAGKNEAHLSSERRMDQTHSYAIVAKKLATCISGAYFRNIIDLYLLTMSDRKFPSQAPYLAQKKN